MDGMPFMEYFDPPLTTVKIEVAELGRTALQMLLGLIEGNYNGNRQIAISLAWSFVNHVVIFLIQCYVKKLVLS